LRQPGGHAQADAAVSAGDDGYLPIQLHIHLTPPYVWYAQRCFSGSPGAVGRVRIESARQPWRHQQQRQTRRLRLR
jgi:hypothetical protein